MSENNVASLLLSHVNMFKEACQNAAIAANGSYDFEGTFYDHDVSAKIDLGQNNVTFYTHVLTNKGTKSTYKALYKAPISDVFCTPEEMPEVVEKHMSGLYVRVRDCKFLEENIPRLNADAMLPLVWEMAPSTWKVTLTGALETYIIECQQGSYNIYCASSEVRVGRHDSLSAALNCVYTLYRKVCDHGCACALALMDQLEDKSLHATFLRNMFDVTPHHVTTATKPV